MPKKDTCIFDIDGTLIDSEKFWRQAEVDVFSKYGIVTDLIEATTHAGLSIPEIVTLKRQDFAMDDVTAEKIIAAIFTDVTEKVSTEGVAKEGVYVALKLLKQHYFTLGLASTSPRFIIEAVLQRLQLTNIFGVVSSAEDEIYGKPHPAVYLSCLKRLNKKPNECIAIEDSFNGVVAAKAAQLTTVAIPEESDKHALRFHVEDYILSSLQEFNSKFLERISS